VREVQPQQPTSSEGVICSRVRSPEVEEFRANPQRAKVPSLEKEGWPRPLIKCREGTLLARMGWFVQTTNNFV
jgi:hypothetical protein